MSFETDSKDYEIITVAIEAIPFDLDGITCEIGLRRGGGSAHIIELIHEKGLMHSTHVAVDPYGNVIYGARDGQDVRYDYTNKMRDETIGALYEFATSRGVNFIFINLDDEEFFQRYANGVPVYDQEKKVINSYKFVHIDGPHQHEPVLNEFRWFNERMPSKATMVFDDILRYDHDKVEKEILLEWDILEKTDRKAAYQKC